MRRSIALSLSLLFPLAATTVRTMSAQVESTTGIIQGDVLDASEGVVPGATLQITNTDTNTTREATSDGSGHFQFPSLQPGNYVLSVSKPGFAKTVEQGISLTVGRALTFRIALTVAAGSETVTVMAEPLVDVSTVSSTSNLDELTIATTPVLGRKFEDLLTLTPGVSITQGPDGDEININGQRGIFNNVSLDGGDYNNGFFGEQVGGQRAAVDITLEAIKEFQVVASGANAEFGRTAGGVVNVITKSGTNNVHGSLFHYQRLEALSANTSDGQPLRDFHREQFGGSLGGAFIKDKLFGFVASEGILENLSRLNLGQTSGSSCPVSNPVFGSNITESQIGSSGDCQRLVLLNYYRNSFKEEEGAPVSHTVRNASIIGRVDWNLSSRNLLYGSYNFDHSRNANQTFDVSSYGNSANGIEGPGKVQTLNVNLVSTLNENRLNEAHVTYAREDRGRSPINPSSVPDTGIGFAPSFRFGQPFFLGPGATELFYRYDLKDNFSLIHGKHSFKFGGEDLYSHNTQIFDGFALGRYIFGSTVGFLHYATPASAGDGFGPNAVQCADGTFHSITACPAVGEGAADPGSSPLLLFLQDAAVRPGKTVQDAGYSDIGNQEISFYAQDTWKAARRLTVSYGLRWESQFFPNPVIAPSETAYGSNLSDPRFPSTGKLPNQTKEFQPRVGFTFDVTGSSKSVLRASWGIFNARQNMLTQVGAITTNGAQQQTITEFSGQGNPTYPSPLPVTPIADPTMFPFQPGVTVFDRNYHNPRIYTTDVGYDQQLSADLVLYADFAMSKGVYLTRFVNPNIGPTAVLPGPGSDSDTASYTGAKPFQNLGDITNTISNSKSLYRGVTIGLRKRMSHGFIFDGNYVYSVDKDDDSNERDPFTFRYANFYNLQSEYADSDRDERHKFNFYTVGNLPFGFTGNIRMQAHSAQPVTDNVLGDGTGAACTINNSATRFVNGVDCGRNHLRKDNQFFTLDLGFARPFHLGDRFAITPRAELFNAFNNANNINPLTSPALFNFDGFLRAGVGDPLQAQLSIRLSF